MCPAANKLATYEGVLVTPAHRVVELVDPAAQTLELFVLDGEIYRLFASYSGEDIVQPPPFDAVSLELARL